MKVTDFVQTEIDYILSNANFTGREKSLFELRNQEKSLEECAELMDCSVSTVSRINKGMKRKIMKLL